MGCDTLQTPHERRAVKKGGLSAFMIFFCSLLRPRGYSDANTRMRISTSVVLPDHRAQPYTVKPTNAKPNRLAGARRSQGRSTHAGDNVHRPHTRVSSQQSNCSSGVPPAPSPLSSRDRPATVLQMAQDTNREVRGILPGVLHRQFRAPPALV